MNFIKKNILFLGASILAYLAAPYFGHVYNNFFPTELNSGWIGGTQSLEFIRGISLSLVFFLTLYFSLVIKKKSRVLWIISPLVLWEISVDLRHIYITIILVIVAFGIASSLRKLFTRLAVNKEPGV